MMTMLLALGCLRWRIVDCQETSGMKVVKYQELGDMLWKTNVANFLMISLLLMLIAPQ